MSEDDRELVRAVFAPDPNAPPPDVVPPGEVTLEDLERQSAAFGPGRAAPVTRSRVTFDVDGRYLGVETEKIDNASFHGTWINLATAKRLNLTRAWFEAHPGIRLVDGGVQYFPDPGQHWDWLTRTVVRDDAPRNEYPPPEGWTPETQENAS